MTLDELASTAATAHGLRWISLSPADKLAWKATVKAVLKKIETPDAIMLNAARAGYRQQNQLNWTAMVRSIR